LRRWGRRLAARGERATTTGAAAIATLPRTAATARVAAAGRWALAVCPSDLGDAPHTRRAPGLRAGGRPYPASRESGRASRGRWAEGASGPPAPRSAAALAGAAASCEARTAQELASRDRSAPSGRRRQPLGHASAQDHGGLARAGHSPAGPN